MILHLVFNPITNRVSIYAVIKPKFGTSPNHIRIGFVTNTKIK